MRIANVITHVLEAKLSQPLGWSFMSTASRASCLVEVICEDGTTGWAALQLLAVPPHNPPRFNPSEPLLEFDRSEHPFRQSILTQPIEHVTGRVTIPERPGLGIEVDRATLARFASKTP